MIMGEINVAGYKLTVAGFGSSEKKRVGVIIPFRHSSDRPDALSRAQNLLIEAKHPAIQFYLVDYGSPLKEAADMREICRENGAEYIYAHTRLQMFSIGKARDIGVICASSEFVFFQDIDFLAYPGFYDDLVHEIEVHELEENNAEFFIVPYMYLSEAGSEEYLQTPPHLRRSKFIQYYTDGRRDIVTMFAPGGSAILMNRNHYLAIGGHDPDFIGHGFEDFEFLHRACFLASRVWRPLDYYNDYKKWDQNDYLGFRAMFRLWGDPLLVKGIHLVHIHHGASKGKSAYMARNSYNGQLVVEKMKAFDGTKVHPEPLPDIHRGATLALGKPTDAFYKSIRTAMPSFGSVVYKSERDFSDPGVFLTFLEENNISRTLMPNPYGNENRLSLYMALRQEGLSYIAMDRGALPKSVFFDNNGFNADSTSYDAGKWDHPLTDEERITAEEYIDSEILSDDALEAQGTRIGSVSLSRRLGIDCRKKVLLVPFQRPSDTVIRYFSGNVRDMNDFARFVEETADHLGEEWVVLAKKHPLETNPVKLKSSKVLYVPDDTHIKDLLELSDTVLVINSGVGVLAMMWEVPVVYVGNVFYAHEDINRCAETSTDAARIIREGFNIDREKVLRLIYYLTNKFYSFGKFENEVKIKKNGSKFNVTRNIHFTKLRLPGCSEISYYNLEKARVPFSSPVFDRYRQYLNIVRENKEVKVKAQPLVNFIDRNRFNPASKPPARPAAPAPKPEAKPAAPAPKPADKPAALAPKQEPKQALTSAPKDAKPVANAASKPKHKTAVSPAQQPQHKGVLRKIRSLFDSSPKKVL
ncbi:MAG: hypothetical protein AB9866_16685 [Syntrophobacteraceae bacterium]